MPDEGGDVEGLHVGELADAAGVAPFCKPARGVQVRFAQGFGSIWESGNGLGQELEASRKGSLFCNDVVITLCYAGL